jgi:uncharacterized membrane protein YedE/YeeE
MNDGVVHAYSVPAWSPYLVGALIGLLAITTLALAQHKVSASSAYAHVAGMLGRLIAPRHIAKLPYFTKNRPALGWSVLFVLGAALGSFIAASTGGEITATYLPDLWIARFGSDSHLLRTGFAVAGGILMAFGARMAGGCTSGHGISGTMQLAVSSWISMLCFFVGGALVACPLYRLW